MKFFIVAFVLTAPWLECSGQISAGGAQYQSATQVANAMKCDGVTDDTAALNAAILSAYGRTGATVVIPATGKKCLITGQITLPNDGGTVFNNSPLQPSLRITGGAASGALVPGGGGTPVVFGSGPAYGGSILDLTFNSTTAKIDTRGVGPLEIDHLTLMDDSTDCATFFYTSNTTVRIHDVTFFGAKVGPLACNDAIMLGNTSVTPSGNFNAPFQGYGSIIDHNYFQNIKRAVVGFSFTNNVVIDSNTVWSSSGNSAGGAFELGCLTCGTAVGNIFSANLIEATAYVYGIRLVNSLNSTVSGTACWDPTPGTFVSCIRLEDPSVSNLIVNTVSSPGAQPYITDTSNAQNGVNTEVGPRAGDPNIFGNPVGTALKATAALTAGQVVKLDASNARSVVVATTSDTGAGIAIGIVHNSPATGTPAQVVSSGRTALPILGTGTCTLGQFVVVDTTTNGRVQCTSSYTAGTVLGIVITAQSSVGSAVGVLLGLR